MSFAEFEAHITALAGDMAAPMITTPSTSDSC
jgi:hypothetical protein